MVTLQIEGQSLELPADIAINDDALRRAIAPLFPQAANARFERATDGEGRTVIKVTKQAGDKGIAAERILAAIQRCRRHVNPAILLHQRVQQSSTKMSPEDLLQLQRDLDQAITKGEHELKVTHAILARLLSAPAVPTHTTPIGF